MSWIANAEAGSSVRAKLNALMIPISSAAISVPVEYIDITLPAGYTRFQLIFDQLAMDTADILCGAFSADAGATFTNNNTNFDSYLNGNADFDALMYLTDVSHLMVTTTPKILASGDVNVDPGSASRYPTIRVNTQYQGDDVGFKFYLKEGMSTFYPTSTVPPTMARQNLLRLLPYGNGDCNPPTSGRTLSSGAFALYGIPT